MYQVIKELKRVRPTRATEFVHATANMYVVATPLAAGDGDSKIEDSFQDDAKSVEVDGKAFDPNNETETSARYGKTVFAHKVVVQRAATLNFTGFRPLLDRIVAVIEEHAERVALQRSGAGPKE
jgi:hypothetical protein